MHGAGGQTSTEEETSGYLLGNSILMLEILNMELANSKSHVHGTVFTDYQYLELSFTFVYFVAMPTYTRADMRVIFTHKQT